MATRKQKLAVAKMVENGGNMSKAMRDAGYSHKTAKVPSKLTDSIGFRELCDECGLTDDFIINALQEDIAKKPQNRKPELELASKIKGLFTDRVDHTSGGKALNIGSLSTADTKALHHLLTKASHESSGDGLEETEA